MLTIDREIVFVDTETTTIDPTTARPWEIALIKRWPGNRLEERTTILIADVDLQDAEAEALAVGRFEERYVDDGRARWLSEADAAALVARVTSSTRRGGPKPLLVGSAVGTFDAPVLAGMLARHGLVPGWWHHPVDLITWTQARESMGPFAPVALTEGSHDLSRLVGVQPPAEPVRHTAMGDALWARAWWDAMTSAVSR